MNIKDILSNLEEIRSLTTAIEREKKEIVTLAIEREKKEIANLESGIMRQSEERNRLSKKIGYKNFDDLCEALHRKSKSYPI